MVFSVFYHCTLPAFQNSKGKKELTNTFTTNILSLMHETSDIMVVSSFFASKLRAFLWHLASILKTI